MVGFIRFVIIAAVLLAIAAYTTAFAVADNVVGKIRPLLTTYLVNIYYTGDENSNLQYQYDAVVRFNPPRVEIHNLYIRARSLKVDDSKFREAHLQIDRIEVELLQLLRDKEVNVTSVDGVRFLGLLTDNQFEQRLVANNENLEEAEISNYLGRFRMRAIFKTVSVRTYTLVGSYAVTDDNVIDLENRDHYGPYGRCSGADAAKMDDDYDYRVRIHVLGKELDGQNVLWCNDGLWIVASDRELRVELPEPDE